ncbi:Laccase-1, partial [Leucoagaricus sp. SymC.cos]
VPVLIRILSGVRIAEALLPTGGELTVPKEKVIRVDTLRRLSGGPHTFHMHKVSFDPLGYFNTNRFKFLDSVRRDMTNMCETEGNFIAFRFKTGNPGLWTLRS